MTTEIEIQVGLKPGMADPEGANVKKALDLLGFNSVEKVNSVKCYRIVIDKNEADAIEDLMSKPALTSAESNWLHMAYIKHGILKVVNGKITRTDKDLGQALDDIRSKVKNKAMKSVASHDKAQAAYMAQPDDDEEMDEDLRMNKRGKIEYDVDYSDLPNELEDDFSMAKLKKEYEKAVKNKTTKEAQDIMRLAGL